MDRTSWLIFLCENKVGLKVAVEDAEVLSVKPSGNNLDIEIYDLKRLKKLREEYKNWEE